MMVIYFCPHCPTSQIFEMDTPGIGDDSGGMGSDTNGALQAQGGVY